MKTVKQNTKVLAISTFYPIGHGAYAKRIERGIRLLESTTLRRNDWAIVKLPESEKADFVRITKIHTNGKFNAMGGRLRYQNLCASDVVRKEYPRSPLAMKRMLNHIDRRNGK